MATSTSRGLASVRYVEGFDGGTHFLTRPLERVSTEMSLHILAYNLKRVMKIIGIEDLKTAMQA